MCGPIYHLMLETSFSKSHAWLKNVHESCICWKILCPTTLTQLILNTFTTVKYLGYSTNHMIHRKLHNQNFLKIMRRWKVRSFFFFNSIVIVFKKNHMESTTMFFHAIIDRIFFFFKKIIRMSWLTTLCIFANSMLKSMLLY